jgi:hypothetical protein
MDRDDRPPDPPPESDGDAVAAFSVPEMDCASCAGESSRGWTALEESSPTTRCDDRQRDAPLPDYAGKPGSVA